MAEFKSDADLMAWVDQQPNGIKDLEEAIRNDRFSGPNRTRAVRYLDSHRQEMLDWQRAAEVVGAEQERDLMRRSTNAAERSADAAVESAAASVEAVRHARDAASWAKWAVIVAAVALIVSVGPQIARLIRGL